MIAVDTSALMAIVLDEDQAAACRDVLEAEAHVVISAWNARRNPHRGGRTRCGRGDRSTGGGSRDRGRAGHGGFRPGVPSPPMHAGAGDLTPLGSITATASPTKWPPRMLVRCCSSGTISQGPTSGASSDRALPWRRPGAAAGCAPARAITFRPSCRRGSSARVRAGAADRPPAGGARLRTGRSETSFAASRLNMASQHLVRLPGGSIAIMCIFVRKDTLSWRTNIVIDDALIAEAMKSAGVRTKREAVDLGLRALLKLGRQEEIRRFRGKLDWTGDLDAMRRDG